MSEFIINNPWTAFFCWLGITIWLGCLTTFKVVIVRVNKKPDGDKP